MMKSDVAAAVASSNNVQLLSVLLMLLFCRGCYPVAAAVWRIAPAVCVAAPVEAAIPTMLLSVLLS